MASRDHAPTTGIALEDEPFFIDTCARCAGSGEIGDPYPPRDDPYAMTTCPDCRGCGFVEGEPDQIEEEDLWP